MIQKNPPRRLPPVPIIFICAALCLVRSGAEIVAAPGGKEPAPAAESAIAHNNLGIALLAQFKAGDAEKEFLEALAAFPAYLPALVNVGIAQLAQVRYPEATQSFERALKVEPNSVHAHYNLSLIFKIQGKTDEGIQQALAAAAGDERDPDLHYNLGSLYQSARDFDKAIYEYQTALKLDPNLLPAYYSLGRAFISKGDLESGKKFMQKHQELQAASNLPASSSGLKYGEQGRYSFAMEDLSGRNAAAAPLAEGEITFTEVTGDSGIVFAHAGGGDPLSLRSPLEAKGDIAAVIRDQVAPYLGSGVGVADLDGDGAEDLIFPNTKGRAPGIFLNKGKMTFAAGAAAGFPAGNGMGVAAGDVNNDGNVDLLLTRYGGVSLLLGDGKGGFTAGQLPPLKDGYFAAGGSLADIDHDGDLDIFIAGLLSPPNPPHDPLEFPGDFAGEEIRVFRNNGNGSFTDVTAAARFGDATKRSSGAVFSDFDNDRDIDVAVARLGQGIGLYTNNRDGTFTDIGPKAGLPAEGNYLGILAVDYNRDGWMDIVATAWDSSLPRFFRNDGTGSFALDVMAVADVPRGGNGPLFGCAAADVDDDGFPDILAVNGSDKGAAIRLLHNLGPKGFEDASVASGLAAIPARRGRGLAVADLDGDGDLDLVISNNGGPPTILRNDGGNRNHWLSVTAKGLNSNRQGVGTKVEVKAGTLWEKTEIASGSGYLSSSSLRPFFGLGHRTSVDALRLLWPGGVLQDEIRVAADVPYKVEELDRKGTSCPILYAWDGTQVAFVTDFLGGSAFGYLTAPATWNTPDTDEYVRIPAEKIAARDGRYDLFLNNQLEETIYFDRAQLVAVDHPAGTEAYPDERLVEEPPFPGFKIHVVSSPHPPVEATDDRGHDVTDRIARIDRLYPDGFPRLPFKGYAARHALTLDLGPIPAEGAVLLMTAWIDYADSTSNLAASQSGLALVPPFLEALDPATGSWVLVLRDMGFPAGLPKTMTVDLTRRLPAGARKIRITTSMRIYWDQILVSTPAGIAPAITRLDPVSAVLRWRGFPLSVMPDGKPPALYDYARDEGSIFWKAHAGFYTRYGDVRPLLAAVDDRYVITRGGDEIALSFDASRLPKLAPGATRTFLLYADGFGKDMDINSARPDRVGPLPYHAMPGFPYPASASYPLDERAMRYLDEYNTRYVESSVTPLGP
jgi:Flp pilus assembly protein TadD